MTQFFIIGTGDHSRVALETARQRGMEPTGFIEPAEGKPTPESIAGIRVLHGVSTLVAVEERPNFLVAIGSNRVRQQLFAAACAMGANPVPLTHPTAVLLGGAVVGRGSHVCAGAIIGVDVIVGDDVIINTGAVVDHDCTVADHAFIAPGSLLAGRVAVAQGAHLGIGATVLEGRRIGSWSLVAAGAVVTRDVSASARMAGVPARPMQRTSTVEGK